MAHQVPVEVARPWAPLWLRRAGTLAAAIYLPSIWLDAAGSTLPAQILPRPVHFFAQVAELFPKAAEDVIEWRARAWRCDLGRYEQMDVRPLFPIRRDDKENQFGRAMHFYHRDREVLEALDSYLVAAENLEHPDSRIGGVMLLSIRAPIPPLGEAGPRERWMSIDEFPPSVTRKYWYTTAPRVSQGRCQAPP